MTRRDNAPLEWTAAAVYFTCGRASRVRRHSRSTALRYAAMERLHTFNLGGTSQLVTRHGEWKFFVRVADGDAKGVRLVFEFADHELGYSSPKGSGCALPVGKHMRVVMRRADRTKENVTFRLESVENGRAIFVLGVPEGVVVAFEDERGPATE